MTHQINPGTRGSRTVDFRRHTPPRFDAGPPRHSPASTPMNPPRSLCSGYAVERLESCEP